MKKKKKAKNSNYQTGFEASLKKLPEYQDFRNHQFFEQLKFVCSTNTDSSEFTKVLAEQLALCSRQSFPDYACFRSKMAAYLSSAPQIDTLKYKKFIFGDSTDSETLRYSMPVIYIIGLYHSFFRTAPQNGSEHTCYENRPELAGIYNRYKLMISLYDESCRERLFEFVESLETISSLSEENLLDFGSAVPTAHMIMTRLNYALANNLKVPADRLIGSLMMLKNSLSPGEYEYFSAMVYMKDSSEESLNKALDEINRIPETAVEYIPSRGMLAEVLALKGDPDAFIDVFKYSQHINHSAMLYYIQLLILNMTFASSDCMDFFSDSSLRTPEFEKLRSLISVYNEKYPFALSLKRGTSEWLLYTGNLLKASAVFYHFFRDVNDMLVDEIVISESVIRAQYVILTTGIGKFQEELNDILQNPSYEKRLSFIRKYFDTAGSAVYNTAHTELSLKAYREFLSDEEFAGYFKNNLSDFKKLLTDEQLRVWLSEAYLSAVSSDSPWQEMLTGELSKICSEFDVLNRDEITYRTVCGLLAPNEQLLYTSAESAYLTASASDYGWKDAGMLSLSFFRIIEVVLRERLLVKAFGKNNPAVNAWLNELNRVSRNDADYDALIYAGSPDDRFIIKSTVSVLKNPAKLTMEQMEYCFRLLSDNYTVNIRWLKYQNELKQIFYSVLTPEGINAAKSNRFSDYICYQNREAYRNPPAHARYLPFEKATECRSYVNDTLRTVISEFIK